MHNIQAFRPGASQTIAYTATSGVVASAVGTQTYLVRIVTTSDAFVKIAAAPVAAAADVFMPANTPEYFVINPGEKVAAVQVSAGGNLHITELTK